MKINNFIVVQKKLKEKYTFKNKEREKLIAMGKISVYNKDIPKYLKFYINDTNEFPPGVMQFIKRVEEQKDRIKVFFRGTLFDYQNKAIGDLLKSGEGKTGIIVAGTGSGKSVIICNLIANVFKEKTLILVKNIQLIHQIKSSVLRFTSINEDRVGIFGDGKKEIKDITIMTQSSFIKNAELVSNFATVMVDECDTFMGSSTINALCKLEPNRVIGFTATPFTSSKHAMLLEMIFGKIVKVDYTLPSPDVLSIKYRTKMGYTECCNDLTYNEYRKDFLDSDKNRLALQIKVIKSAIKSKRVKHVIVLYDRIDAVNSFYNNFNNKFLSKENININYIIGDIKFEERKKRIESFKNDGGVLVATESTVGRGFDLPRIDSVAIFFPNKFKGRLIQMIGRGLRKDDNKNKPLIIDWGDTGVWFQARDRIKTYKKMRGNKIDIKYVLLK